MRQQEALKHTWRFSFFSFFFSSNTSLRFAFVFLPIGTDRDAANICFSVLGTLAASWIPFLVLREVLLATAVSASFRALVEGPLESGFAGDWPSRGLNLFLTFLRAGVAPGGDVLCSPPPTSCCFCNHEAGWVG